MQECSHMPAPIKLAIVARTVQLACHSSARSGKISERAVKDSNWPGQVEDGPRLVAANLSFRSSPRPRLGGRGDRPKVAESSQRGLQIHRPKPDLRSSAQARFPSRPGKTAHGRFCEFRALPGSRPSEAAPTASAPPSLRSRRGTSCTCARCRMDRDRYVPP